MTEVLRFNPSSTLPERAIQAWQILVGVAITGKTITYLDLSKLMFRTEAAGVPDRVLGHIAFYCKAHGLPQLNVIVVNKGTGKPGDKIPLSSQALGLETKNVFAEDWYDIHPPTKAALIEAYEGHHRKPEII